MTPSNFNSAVAVGSPSHWSDLSGMTVLVTGASSGIGRAAAVALAACGADIILLARNERSLEEVRSEILSKYPVGIQTVVADLSNTAETRKLILSLPIVTALVNSAGQNIPQSLEDVDDHSFDAIFALNVKATFFVAQACVARFRKDGHRGAIVNVSSQMGHVGARKRAVYCGSKHAVEGITKAMAIELAPEGIRVNSVCPTFIATPMTTPMFESAEFRSEVEARIPMGRVGSVDEVTGAIVFLLSSAASLITGSSLLIDGGWTAQ